MDYTIVTHSQQKELVAEVKKLIAEGWRPLGGVTSNSFFYNQAMVKPDPVEDTVEANKAAWPPPTEVEGGKLYGNTAVSSNGVTNSPMPVKRSHKKKNP